MFLLASKLRTPSAGDSP